MALRPVDKLIAGYLAVLTIVILVRDPLGNPANAWMLVLHALVGGLLILFSRLRPDDAIGRVIHDLYPLVLLLPLYAEIGLLNDQLDAGTVLANDAVVQRWEEMIFHSQISFTWLRQYPSVFWSAVLHVAYFAYYPIVLLGPVLLVIRGRRRDARAVIFTVMVAFVVCYLAFVFYPVAGPYYAFDRPTGPVREVWSARVVYGLLAGGSSFGAAFPSSHVAATVAAVLALWRVWRPLAAWFAVPCLLLIVGTVYCQMHYGVDAGTGIAVGMVAVVVGVRGQGPGIRTATRPDP